MDLIEYFNKIDTIPNQTNLQLDELFVRKNHYKGDIILQPGNLSNNLIFVEEGLLRLFYEKDEKDITFLFLAENSFSLPIQSVIYNQPSPYGCEVLEDCCIRIVKYDQFKNQLEKIPALEKIARIVLFDALLKTSNRLMSIQFQSAEQRYENLLQTYPDILLRTSLYNISTYLGITQQTLSVIRSRYKNSPNSKSK